MAVALSREDVARLTGSEVEVVRQWQADGLLPDGALDLRDMERAHLIRALSRRGLAADAIREALVKHRDMVETFLDQVVPAGDTSASLQDVVTAIGVDATMVERVLDVIGLDQSVPPSPDDIEAMRTLHAVLAAGFPADALLQLVRVYSDALDRVADAEVKLFHI
jgi:adenylate cyclase